MKISVIQASPVFLNKSASTEKALLLMNKVATNGAELCIFPEAFIAGYPIWLRPNLISSFTQKELKQAYGTYLSTALSVTGPEITALIKESKKLELLTYIGFIEEAQSLGTVYCSFAVIHPKKGLINIHRKLMPTFHERLIWSQGDGHGLRVHQFKQFKIGGLICYENLLPLARQALYAQGEQLHVTIWPCLAANQINLINQFIALEGRIFVAASCGVLTIDDIPDSFILKNKLSQQIKIIHAGGSMIVSPDGSILSEPVENIEIELYATLDINTVLPERMKLDPAGHYNRADIFSLSINKDRIN